MLSTKQGSSRCCLHSTVRHDVFLQLQTTLLSTAIDSCKMPGQSKHLHPCPGSEFQLTDLIQCSQHCWSSSQMSMVIHVLWRHVLLNSEWTTQSTAMPQAMDYFISFRYSLKRFYTKVENSYYSGGKKIHCNSSNGSIPTELSQWNNWVFKWHIGHHILFMNC